MRKICWSPGLCPGPCWGSLQRSPRPSSWWGGGFAASLPKNPTYNIVIVLVLCVCNVHTCMKMHCYFPLNVKHGASQLYLGGASNYLAPALLLPFPMPLCGPQLSGPTCGLACRTCMKPNIKMYIYICNIYFEHWQTYHKHDYSRPLTIIYRLH